MKRHHAALLASLLLLASTTMAQTPSDTADARAAAERWMKLMDTEQYSSAWETGASSMRKDLPKFAWNMLASTVRLPLGSVRNRTFKSSDLTAATPNKPASVTLNYAGDYETSHNVQEKITTVQEADGQWRVSGFSIKADTDKQSR